MRRLTWKHERGAVAVEFALVFPILILVLVGIIEYGAVFNAQLMVTGAAREASRSMALTSNTGSATSAALAASPALVPALKSSDVGFSSASCPSGSDVTVTITYNKPYLTGMFGATIQLTGVATRRCGG
jgi:Flp pilus assembly protein TadG